MFEFLTCKHWKLKSLTGFRDIVLLHVVDVGSRGRKESVKDIVMSHVGCSYFVKAILFIRRMHQTKAYVAFFE